MCIIAAKVSGVSIPSEELFHNMWSINSDGAGFMYTKNNRVIIEKGFMKFKDFMKRINALSSEIDTTATPMVFHFRITTHGGTRPENTHPFPITDNLSSLKKLRSNSVIGVAHNGIIPITPRKGISDTMEYIVSQLAPLHRAMPNFLSNKDALLLIKNAIESKMAFLTASGRIVTIGNFIEEDGILYSNDSYLGYARYRSLSGFKSYGYGGWDDYEDYEDVYRPDLTPDNARELMWLSEKDCVRFSNGEIREGECYLISDDGYVWGYDFDTDCAVKITGALALNEQGMTVRFDPDDPAVDYLPVCYSVTMETPIYD